VICGIQADREASYCWPMRCFYGTPLSSTTLSSDSLCFEFVNLYCIFARCRLYCFCTTLHELLHEYG